MVDENFSIKYNAVVFDYIDEITITDFPYCTRNKIISVNLFNDFELNYSFDKNVFYERVYFKGKNIQSFERIFKRITEKEVLNSFYTLIYFLLSESEESNKLFELIKVDKEFMEKIELFTMTNPSTSLDLQMYSLKKYTILLYKNFTNNKSDIIIIEKDKFRDKYFLFNTYDERNFVLKEEIEKDKLIYFISEYIKKIEDNFILKSELEDFLLLSIS